MELVRSILHVLVITERSENFIPYLDALRAEKLTVRARFIANDEELDAAIGSIPDLLLIDHQHENLGFEKVLSVLQRRNTAIPILLIIPSAIEKSAVDLIRRGATDYVCEGDFTRLVVAFKKAIECHSHYDSFPSQIFSENIFHSLMGGETGQIEGLRLQAAYHLQEKIFSGLREVVILQDPTTRAVLQISAACYDVFGYSPQELLGKTTKVLYENEKEYDEIGARIREGLDQNGVFRVTTKMQRRDGQPIHVDLSIADIRDETGQQICVIVSIHDITEAIQSEMALQSSEEKYRALVEQNTQGIALVDETGTVIEWNQALERITGIPISDAIGATFWDIDYQLTSPDRRSPEQYVLRRSAFRDVLQSGQVKMFDKPIEVEIRRPDGTSVVIQQTIFPVKTAFGYRVASISQDITERKKTEQALLDSEARERQKAKELEAIMDAVPAFVWVSHDRDCQHMTANRYGYEALKAPVGANVSLSAPKDQPLTYSASKHGRELRADEMPMQIAAATGIPQRDFDYEVTVNEPEETIYHLYGNAQPMYGEGGSVEGVVGVFLDISRLKQTENELKEANLFNEEIVTGAGDGIIVCDEQLRYQLWNPYMERLTGFPQVEVIGKKAVELFPFLKEQGVDQLMQRVLNGETVQSIEIHNNLPRTRRSGWVSATYAPHRDSSNRIVGVIGTMTDITARKKAEQKIQSQLQRLSALRKIDTAINMKLPLSVGIGIVLEQVIEHLGVKAADILLFDSKTNILEFGESRGFNTDIIKSTRVHLGEGIAGTVAAQKISLMVADLARDIKFTRGNLLEAEGLDSYHGAPLIANGVVVGILEVFHRDPLQEDQEWIDYFETLAGQAAIAIEDARMFSKLRESNEELTRAYNETILGWSRAMDLRDHDTEGHSQRVTEMSIRLVRKIGLSEDEITHIRWGALLHDLGKMGTPDSILLKAGSLTPEEWDIMRRHPQYAFDLLSPIAFLKPSIDIPYCHHEKWDGSGYPRGLKSTEIPLAAHIFAIVDVWDALLSDRPYRKGWPKEKIIEHLRDQSGRHFDPEVVEAFINLLDENE